MGTSLATVEVSICLPDCRFITTRPEEKEGEISRSSAQQCSFIIIKVPRTPWRKKRRKRVLVLLMGGGGIWVKKTAHGRRFSDPCGMSLVRQGWRNLPCDRFAECSRLLCQQHWGLFWWGAPLDASQSAIPQLQGTPTGRRWSLWRQTKTTAYSNDPVGGLGRRVAGEAVQSQTPAM